MHRPVVNKIELPKRTRFNILEAQEKRDKYLRCAAYEAYLSYILFLPIRNRFFKNEYTRMITNEYKKNDFTEVSKNLATDPKILFESSK